MLLPKSETTMGKTFCYKNPAPTPPPAPPPSPPEKQQQKEQQQQQQQVDEQQQQEGGGDLVHLENQTWAIGEDEEDEGNDKDEDELPELLNDSLSLAK